MSRNGFMILLDNSEIESFSEDHALISEDAYEQEDDFQEKLDLILEILGKIPKREADMIRAYYLKSKFQSTIGDMFDVSQGDVSYKLKRGIERIQFLLSFPHIDSEVLERDLIAIMPSECPKDPKYCGGNLYLKIMLGMFKSSCQSVVADSLKIYQGRVRYRFYKGIRLIKNHIESLEEQLKTPEVLEADKSVAEGIQSEIVRYSKYVKAFEMLKSKPNILRALKVQKRWQHKFKDIID